MNKTIFLNRIIEFGTSRNNSQPFPFFLSHPYFIKFHSSRYLIRLSQNGIPYSNSIHRYFNGGNYEQRDFQL